MADWRAGKMPDVDLRRVTPQRTQNALYGLGAALPSPFGDAAGLAGDAVGYASDPRSRTSKNALLSVAGLIPGIPAVGAMRKIKSPFASDMVSEFVFDAAKYAQGPLDRKGWLEMLNAYKGKFYDGDRLPVEIARIRNALKQGDISGELNAYMNSGYTRDPKDAEMAWAALSEKLGLVD